MVLSNLITLVETVDLTSLGNEIVIFLGAYVGVDITTKIVTAIKLFFNGKKNTKLFNFSANADLSIKGTEKKLQGLIADIKDEVVTRIVNPLLQEVQNLKNENLELKELNIISLSLTNMPLEQKKALLEATRASKNISDNLTKYLETAIQVQEKQQAEIVETNNDLEETINNM